MIRIDDSLLEELGLITLPKAERDALLRQIYETLEMRVGMKLAERMNDQQLDEFERFIDGDMAFTESYLTSAKPDWQSSEPYKVAVTNAQAAAQKRGVDFNENAVKSEFGALTWLETNFPDYKQVVASELEKLKGEVKLDAPKIVEAAQLGAAVQPPVTQPQPIQPPQYQPAPPAAAPGAGGVAQMPPQQPPQPQYYDQNQQPPMAA